ncbi:MAG: YcgN family cysteine cluster protein [Pseudomonadota bacterium]
MSFWRERDLAALSADEWESLCDGCGRCCLHKLDDGDSVAFTCVSCRLLDISTVRCRSYADRAEKVRACVVLTPDNLPGMAAALPGTCAYRLLHEGADLPTWHPLVSGSPTSVREAGVSVSELAVPETRVPRGVSFSCYVTSLYTPKSE